MFDYSFRENVKRSTFKSYKKNSTNPFVFHSYSFLKRIHKKKYNPSQKHNKMTITGKIIHTLKVSPFPRNSMFVFCNRLNGKQRNQALQRTKIEQRRIFPDSFGPSIVSSLSQTRLIARLAAVYLNTAVQKPQIIITIAC